MILNSNWKEIKETSKIKFAVAVTLGMMQGKNMQTTVKSIY